MTLVATDIAGSTELWEVDRAAMMAALAIHDSLIRGSLSKFHGYEVSTEASVPLLLTEASCTWPDHSILTCTGM